MIKYSGSFEIQERFKKQEKENNIKSIEDALQFVLLEILKDVSGKTRYIKDLINDIIGEIEGYPILDSKDFIEILDIINNFYKEETDRSSKIIFKIQDSLLLDSFISLIFKFFRAIPLKNINDEIKKNINDDYNKLISTVEKDIIRFNKIQNKNIENFKKNLNDLDLNDSISNSLIEQHTAEIKEIFNRRIGEFRDHLSSYNDFNSWLHGNLNYSREVSNDYIEPLFKQLLEIIEKSSDKTKISKLKEIFNIYSSNMEDTFSSLLGSMYQSEEAINLFSTLNISVLNAQIVKLIRSSNYFSYVEATIEEAIDHLIHTEREEYFSKPISRNEEVKNIKEKIIILLSDIILNNDLKIEKGKVILDRDKAESDIDKILNDLDKNLVSFNENYILPKSASLKRKLVHFSKENRVDIEFITIQKPITEMNEKINKIVRVFNDLLFTRERMAESGIKTNTRKKNIISFFNKHRSEFSKLIDKYPILEYIFSNKLEEEVNDVINKMELLKKYFSEKDLEVFNSGIIRIGKNIVRFFGPSTLTEKYNEIFERSAESGIKLNPEKLNKLKNALKKAVITVLKREVVPEIDNLEEIAESFVDIFHTIANEIFIEYNKKNKKLDEIDINLERILFEENLLSKKTFINQFISKYSVNTDMNKLVRAKTKLFEYFIFIDNKLKDLSDQLEMRFENIFDQYFPREMGREIPIAASFDFSLKKISNRNILSQEKPNVYDIGKEFIQKIVKSPKSLPKGMSINFIRFDKIKEKIENDPDLKEEERKKMLEAIKSIIFSFRELETLFNEYNAHLTFYHSLTGSIIQKISTFLSEKREKMEKELHETSMEFLQLFDNFKQLKNILINGQDVVIRFQDTNRRVVSVVDLIFSVKGKGNKFSIVQKSKNFTRVKKEVELKVKEMAQKEKNWNLIAKYLPAILEETSKILAKEEGKSIKPTIIQSKKISQKIIPFELIKNIRDISSKVDNLKEFYIGLYQFFNLILNKINEEFELTELPEAAVAADIQYHGIYKRSILENDELKDIHQFFKKYFKYTSNPKTKFILKKYNEYKDLSLIKEKESTFLKIAKTIRSKKELLPFIDSFLNSVYNIFIWQSKD